MEIYGLNEVQRGIADTLWECENAEEVQHVIETIGVDAAIVYEMMVAAHFDTVNDLLDTAILEQIARKS